MPIEPQWWDSFNAPANVSDISTDYTWTAGINFSTVDDRRSVGIPISSSTRHLTYSLRDPGAHFCTGVRWRFGSTLRADNGVIVIRDSGGSTLCAIRPGADGGETLELEVGGDVKDTTFLSFGANRWHYVQIEVYVAAAGFVRGYYGNELILEWEGDTTALSAAFTVRHWVSSGTAHQTTIFLTDLYVAHVTGADEGVPGNVLGPIIAPEVPVSSDVSTQWTRSSGADTHALLATMPHDGDDNHVESDTADEEDVLGVDASEITELPIVAVGVVTTARQPVEGSLLLRHGITSGAVTEYGDPFSVVEAYRTRMVGRWLTDPADDGEWTPAKVDALNLRYQSRSA
jgi:hypothetical protein